MAGISVEGALSLLGQQAFERVGGIFGASPGSSRQRRGPYLPPDSTSPRGHRAAELYQAPCLHNQLQSSSLQAVNRFRHSCFTDEKTKA